jgi:hypothetical protein
MNLRVTLPKTTVMLRRNARLVVERSICIVASYEPSITSFRKPALIRSQRASLQHMPTQLYERIQSESGVCLWCTCTKSLQLSKDYSDERWTQVNYADKQQSSVAKAFWHCPLLSFRLSSIVLSGRYSQGPHSRVVLCGSNASIGQGWWLRRVTMCVVEDFRVTTSEFPQVYLTYPFLWLCPFIMREKCTTEQLAAHMPINTVIWHFEEPHRASNECKGIVLDRLKWHNLPMIIWATLRLWHLAS